MSVLLIGPPTDLAAAVTARLISQNDEVRAVEPTRDSGAPWKEWGAHVAYGDPADADLVERAAQNVRTIVLLHGGRHLAPGVLEAVLRGGAAAGVDRFVCCSERPADEIHRTLLAADVDHVILIARPKSWRRPGVPLDAVAEAIDAADDLGGHPRLYLDLARDDSWSALLLAPPAARA